MAIPTVSFDFSVATETVVFFWRGGGGALCDSTVL